MVRDARHVSPGAGGQKASGREGRGEFHPDEVREVRPYRQEAPCPRDPQPYLRPRGSITDSGTQKAHVHSTAPVYDGSKAWEKDHGSRETDAAIHSRDRNLR